MRHLVLIAVLICAALPARAEEARESRYGPRPDRRGESLGAPTGYSGPVLGWAGKPAPVQAPAPQTPMSEPWRRLGTRPQAPVTEPSQRSAAPQTIYDLAPSAAAETSPPPSGSPPPTVQPMGTALARTYSVGRQYGLQPDALPPLQPNGMVFIAPSDEAPRLKDDDQPPRHGSPEWLAAGPGGDEDGDRDGGDGSR